jgi:diguanylate cyclase
MRRDRLIGPEGLAVGHRSIDEIGRTAQPVSPRNYEVWLTYLTDSSPSLRTAIDDMIASGAAFDEAAMDALYQKHFAGMAISHDAVDTGSRIAHEVADALDALRFVAMHAERYGDSLDKAVSRLESAPIDAGSLRHLVSHLAKATTQMAEQHETLASKLAESSAEMEQLRVSLSEARKQSLTDAMTGVANRKRFDETLRMRLGEAQHDRTPLTVAMCDIDHFKKFNDTWGHQTGDAVIRLVAGSLAKFALPDQLVARLGGEEFAIIMPRLQVKDAAQLADDIRRAIHANRLRRKETEEVLGHISVSFGIASLRPGETAAQLLARADDCLYLSKRNGRNRVSVEAELDAAA